MKAAAIILARVTSTRLERKMLRDLAGMPLVAHTLRRASSFPGVTDGGGVVLAIPDCDRDDELAAIGADIGMKVFRGSEDNVLSRLILAAESVGADVIYRVTGDNPLVDTGVVSGTWDGFISGEWDYAAMDDTPLGTTAEIVTVDALRRGMDLADTARLREHPTLALYENSKLFRMHLIQPPEKWRRPDWRFTIDTEKDLQVVERILKALGPDATLDSIVPYVDEHPELMNINAGVDQSGWDNLKKCKDAIGYV